MKISLLLALFTCLIFVELSHADSLTAPREHEIRRELCRLEMATKQIAPSEQKKFKKGCVAELNLAGWLGEFFYDPNFYPEGFGQRIARPASTSIDSNQSQAR
jgi:hypothetical protein